MDTHLPLLRSVYMWLVRTTRKCGRPYPTSDSVVHVEAVSAVRAEAPVHLRQLHPHELRRFGTRSSPHVQMLEDREAA